MLRHWLGVNSRAMDHGFAFLPIEPVDPHEPAAAPCPGGGRLPHVINYPGPSFLVLHNRLVAGSDDKRLLHETLQDRVLGGIFARPGRRLAVRVTNGILETGVVIPGEKEIVLVTLLPHGGSFDDASLPVPVVAHQPGWRAN